MVISMWRGGDATLIGARVLLLLRVVLIGTMVIFGAFGVASVTADVEPPVRLWLLPAAAGLAAQVICRAPARRGPEFGRTVFLAAAVSTILCGPAAFTRSDPVLGFAFALGILTLILMFLWRKGESP